MTKEVMQQVLDALNESGLRWPNIVEAIKALEEALKQEQEPVNQFNPDWDAMAVMIEEQQRMAKRIEELEAELAKQEQDEPVAWYDREIDCAYTNSELNGCEVSGLEPLYTTPQQRKPLTDEQILHIVSTHIGEISPSYPLDNSDWINFAHAIESAHGIKE